tara:strand:+ start:1283 stop:1477 length:195 start_codon:yes stop_codon:yes gene_type:complete
MTRLRMAANNCVPSMISGLLESALRKAHAKGELPPPPLFSTGSNPLETIATRKPTLAERVSVPE